MAAATDLIRQYFDLAPGSEAEPYFAQFADDAVVLDDGAEYRGLEAIRAWRTSVPSVVYQVGEVRTAGGEHSALVEIAGAFPGSPVRLVFQFRFTADGRIAALTIAP